VRSATTAELVTTNEDNANHRAGDGAYIVAGGAVTPAVGITVTVGAGGTAGTSGAAGGSGYVWIEVVVNCEVVAPDWVNDDPAHLIEYTPENPAAIGWAVIDGVVIVPPPPPVPPPPEA
jgi:hypothetical protein